MTAVIAFGAVSALGRGAAAVSAGDPGAPAHVAIARDEELSAAGLARPFAARATIARDPGDDRDRATRLLAAALSDCLRELDDRRPGWRRARVGLAIGTSSGGMRTAEALFAKLARREPIDRAEAARAAYFGPLLDAVAGLDLVFSPATLVLCACASSAIAIGLASRWLARGECDLALAGGFDAVSTFVASGFESLQATSAHVPPRPFRLGRDGMALGEGAAVLALAHETPDSPGVIGYVCGFGASADAVHLTAPDRTGAGLARASRAALDDACNPRVDLVSAHATATPFNDAAEARALEAALGESRAHEVIAHAFKAQIGHTLGAAGALESLAAFDAMARGFFPATAGEGALEPGAPRVLERAERSVGGGPSAALKLASAFGGANAALVLAHDPPAPRSQRPSHTAWITRAARVSSPPDLGPLARSIGTTLDKLARADAHVTWALAALDALATRLGGREAFGDAGIVVGTAAATLETNALFAARLRDRGARFVEPRRFPFTSPNAVAGECGVAFGLHGPSFAVGAGLHAGIEALAIGADLVRSGDAERMLVVAVDDVGPAARAWAEAIGAPTLAPGAVAVLVTRDRTASSVARVARTQLSLGPLVDAPSAPSLAAAGHHALAPLDAGTPPARVESASALLGTSARARVDLAAN